ncbi:glutamine amidotransferase [Hydrogenobacter hydrogenophilus]|uniref:Imidazole glycerol phosphate synthase subunit HisH n=1 Tax=Hydrogenobacter hydrogenophilus TaxID=35835 RepID=A0A285P0X7_9AQUI|nr:glutamine amidotransferase [Hydrogenobacter hydrogenophilus]
MITALIDYGMGNLRSVSKALEKVGIKPLITSDPHIVSKAEAVVLPGVGAFKDAVQNLKKAGLFSAVIRHIEKGKPYLGICLGLQLLFERSYEFGTEEGFGLLEGDVVLLPTTVKVPHIGWNQVWKKKDSRLFENIKDGDYFYFVHSYHVVPKKGEVIATLTDYGINFVSAVEYGNVFGVQFHPEKSQKLGLKVLENFKKVVYG